MRSGRVKAAALAVTVAAVAALGLAGCAKVFGDPKDNPAQEEDPQAALMRQLAEAQAAQQQQPPADAAAMAAFLEANKHKPGVKVTPSGLQYKIVKSGPAGGAPAGEGDEVKVNYEGTLSDGTPFDASQPGEPATFRVGAMVPGFDEALKMMRPGDVWMLYIPSELGYPQGRPGIPPGSVLVFKLEILEILPSVGATAQG